MPQAYDREKLRELTLYIAEKLGDSRYFGATVLNKALFYCDFEWFRETGEALTGATYQKLNYGPAPRQMLSVYRSLTSDGSAEMIVKPTYVGRQRRLVPKRKADLSRFKPEEIGLVNDVLDWLRDASAGSLSHFSHRHLGWKLAAYQEDIPYFTVHLCDEGALPGDIKRGIELAKERGWMRDIAIAP